MIRRHTDSQEDQRRISKNYVVIPLAFFGTARLPNFVFEAEKQSGS